MTAPASIPLVLLRRSAKKAPDGSGADVLVPADPGRDDVAARVAALFGAPGSYGQLVLRLDRAVKTYLAGDPAVVGRQRANLDEPAHLFLSDRQGGYPAEHFWMEMPDGSLREKRDVPFVDTVVNERDLLPGRPDGVEAIYAHELGHLMMASLAGSPPRKASSAVHFMTVRTDAWTAFVEGFGEHFQPMFLDHDPNAAWQSGRDAPMPDGVQRSYQTFAREETAGCWVCPANLTFLKWHGTGEGWLRDAPLRHNLFALAPALPDVLRGDARPAREAAMYRDVMPPPVSGPLKNAAQMLESESVVATLFYRLASDHRLRDTYRDAPFYERFLSAGERATLAVAGPRALVTPAENVYLKLFDVFHTTFKWRDWPAADIVRAYAARFPDEAGAAYDVFLDVTSGVTVDAAAPSKRGDRAWLAGLRDDILAGRRTLDAAVGPPLWITVPGFRLGMGLFRYFPMPVPLTFDLNAADETDLRSLPGVSYALASAIVAARGSRVSFGSVEDLAAVPGVDAALMAKLRDMRARMQARMERSQTRQSDAGWIRDYLVLMLRASYVFAAIWQYGSLIGLAGLAGVVAWKGTRRMWAALAASAIVIATLY